LGFGTSPSDLFPIIVLGFKTRAKNMMVGVDRAKLELMNLKIFELEGCLPQN
jgi:hypothetical protein